MVWTLDVKLALLFSIILLSASFVFVAIMLHSIGSISNLLNHLEEIFLMESELRINRYVGMLQQNRIRRLNQVEHERRQEALLAIPLVRTTPTKPGKG